MMLSSAVSLLLHYRGLPSLRRQPLLQTIHCLLDQQLNEATAQQAWSQSVASLPLILPLFNISFCNRQPAGCWTSRTGTQIPAFSQEHRGLSYCQSTRDSHTCMRHWLPVWQRSEKLFPASWHHERAKPSSCGGGTAGGRPSKPTAETRCSWRTGPGASTAGALQRVGGWQQSPCSGALRCPVSRAIPTARGPCPVPSPGQTPWLQPHVLSHSHSPGCSPIITSGVLAISCFT